MKRSYKNLLCFALSGLLCSFSIFTANAQRGGRGGGGGLRGGGMGMSRPSFGGGGGISRGGGSGPSFGSRPSFGNRGSAMTAPRMSAPNSITRSNPSGRFNNGGGRIVAPGSRYNNSYGSRVYRNPGYYRPGYGRPGYNRYYPNRYNNRYYYGGRYYYGNRYYPYRGFYYPHAGFYASLYMPRIGFSLGVLPYGYYPFYWDNSWYYYSNGYYYQQQNDQYTVVAPPVGAEIKELPSDAKPIKINGVEYYELNGVYYEQVTKDDGTTTYAIAGKDGELNTADAGDEQMPLVGDIVTELPKDSRPVTIDGQKVYVSPDGIYYKEDQDANDSKVYRVVGVPGDDSAAPDDEQEDDQ